MINIAIIHPQPLFREGLILLLKQHTRKLSVVITTSNIRQLINGHRSENIDIILWDIPGHHVLNPGTRLLKESFPLAKVIVMVTSHNSVYAGLLETLGANGVIPSDCRMNELIEAIVTINSSYAPPPSSNHVQEPSSVRANFPENLVQVALLWRRGLNESEISEQLNIDESRVKKFLDELSLSSSQQKSK